jgi:hypothetical protein
MQCIAEMIGLKMLTKAVHHHSCYYSYNWFGSCLPGLPALVNLGANHYFGIRRGFQI